MAVTFVPASLDHGWVSTDSNPKETGVSVDPSGVYPGIWVKVTHEDFHGDATVLISKRDALALGVSLIQLATKEA